eukprot:TRINITY_DN20129_c0_g1_i2.p1 TRINITY_DN20129_c0_g1~~TRINITY_DN20129_c0_g1_i2.p1  ORF type:complete len:351 (+),score=21.42 TRINITY_DN20129_c0_g1_i2:81-1133(+)
MVPCKTLIVLLFLVLSNAENRVIQVPVADLRAIPQVQPLTYACCDDYQQTQVLFGECVSVLDQTSDGWLQVEVPDQAYYNTTTKQFVPYPGYLLTNQTVPQTSNYKCDTNAFNLAVNQLQIPVYQRACVPGCLGSDILLYLSIGTKLQKANVDGPSSDWISILLPSGQVGWVLASDVNQITISFSVSSKLVSNIVNTAHQLLGWVYFWGGRSAYDPRSSQQLTGVDCSGLTGLSHQTHGIILPRDASGQFYGSHHGPQVPIQTGTLFFFAGVSGSITHVMLYVGDGYIIESTTSDNSNSTRLYPVQSYYGVPVQNLTYGMQVGTSTLYWGEIGRAVQQECRDRSRMPSSA